MMSDHRCPEGNEQCRFLHPEHYDGFVCDHTCPCRIADAPTEALRTRIARALWDDLDDEDEVPRNWESLPSCIKSSYLAQADAVVRELGIRVIQSRTRELDGRYITDFKAPT